MSFDFGSGMQGIVDSLAKFFPVFREILSTLPWPVLTFFYGVVALLLGFVVARMIVNLIG